jgi:hypothetical protein
MTLNDIARLLADRDNSSPDIDWAGVYDMSESEAERIAAVAVDDIDFEEIWETESWWRDGADSEA